MTEQKNKKNEIFTEVTTIAEEEAKSGQQLLKLTPEELVQRASISLMRCRKQLTNLFGTMSKKQTIRAINAIFDLPMDKLPVMLKTDEEKLAFALGQRAFTDKFIILQHHINEQLKLKGQKSKEETQSNEETRQENQIKNEEFSQKETKKD